MRDDGVEVDQEDGDQDQVNGTNNNLGSRHGWDEEDGDREDGNTYLRRMALSRIALYDPVLLFT